MASSPSLATFAADDTVDFRNVQTDIVLERSRTLRARDCASKNGNDAAPEVVRGRSGKPRFPTRPQKAEKHYTGEVEKPRLMKEIFDKSCSFPFDSDTTSRGQNLQALAMAARHRSVCFNPSSHLFNPCCKLCNHRSQGTTPHHFAKVDRSCSFPLIQILS